LAVSIKNTHNAATPSPVSLFDRGMDRCGFLSEKTLLGGITEKKIIVTLQRQKIIHKP